MPSPPHRPVAPSPPSITAWRLPWRIRSRRERPSSAVAPACRSRWLPPLCVLAGATVAAVHLLDQVATSGDTGTALAWGRSIPIDQRQVHGDMTVTLARGYVDAARVVLGLSVERASGWGPTDVLALELRDPAGVVLPAGGGPGFGGEGGGESAMVYSFGPPTVTRGRIHPAGGNCGACAR